jgi:hypothetical protein
VADFYAIVSGKKLVYFQSVTRSEAAYSWRFGFAENGEFGTQLGSIY